MKKSRKPINQAIRHLDELLAAGQLEAAQSYASTIYQQLTTVPAPAAPLLSGVTVQPQLLTRANQHLRHKAACRIAETYYNHAELELAKQWAEACDFTVNDTFTRRARVLLGHIAMAMDNDDEAIAWYTGLINEKNLYREQPAAYAGLLELLQLTKQDDAVEQWVRHGQHKFRKAGGLRQRFLWSVSRILRRRNHPLWREINAEIVAVTPPGRKWHLKALRELASDARKFARYDEAEAHYRAICDQPLKSTRELVNSHLFLAECQAKQGKDYTATLQELTTKATKFSKPEQRDYATYRIAKFHESVGRNDLAEAGYSTLASGSGKWSAAALTMLAKLAERQGNLRRALDLYLQYPQRYAQKQRLALQAYAGALSVAGKLGNTAATDRILTAIATTATATQDYNVRLNLAYNYRKNGQHDLAKKFLDSGVALAEQELARTSELEQRYKIHFHVLRRLNDFNMFKRVLDWVEAHDADFALSGPTALDLKYQCLWFKAAAFSGLGSPEEAAEILKPVLEQVRGNARLEAIFAETVAMFYDWSGNAAGAQALFEWTAENYPTHPWANVGRLQLAIRKYNTGDIATAIKLVDHVIASIGENSKLKLFHKTYWGAIYLRGCCLERQGRVQEGNDLKQDALRKQPDLRIQNQLRKR